ncbi:MAG TPA: hypothetical protein VM840_01335 [Actinomycetota bacterium]|nr:hypothetical protein [Actinomycetota bacterium]
MARIRGVEPKGAPLLVKATYLIGRRVTRKLMGRDEVLEPYKLLAHSPSVMQAYGLLERALLRSRSVPFDLRELARAKVSTIVGCPW